MKNKPTIKITGLKPAAPGVPFSPKKNNFPVSGSSLPGRGDEPAYPWITGRIESGPRRVPRVATRLTRVDRIGFFLCRVSTFRNSYSVPPGLYAAGSPGTESPVFVSANYKMSFDILRESLEGIDGWILVLDTKGINVWCAAGKGTFGTAELVNRIRWSALDSLVTHRRLIVPQLGAPGVSAHEVAKQTGFRVCWGPVRARDIKKYLAAGLKATPAMRTVTFTFIERLVLTPMEIIPVVKKSPGWIIGFLVYAGLAPDGILFADAVQEGPPLLAALGLAAVSGGFLTPLLLPLLPFRSFALKGWITGLLVLAAYVYFSGFFGLINGGATILFFPAISSYIALQFTGATPFTGITGVKKELKVALPLYMVAAAASAVLMLIHKLIQWSLL